MKELIDVFKTYSNVNNIKVSKTISWIELFRNPNQDCTLGITSKGYWIVVMKDKYQIIEAFKNYLLCLIFLECPINTIKDTIILNYEEIEENFNIYYVFPFIEIVKFAFTKSESDYWIQLALNWYEEFDTDARRTLKKELFSVSINKKFSQSSRHIASKYLKGLESK